MNPDDFIKAILALGTGAGALAFGYQRYAVAQSKKDLSVASDNAQISQIKAMQDAIEANRREMIVIRMQQERMGAQIHKQQTKLTRMEMLLRQFSGLVRQHGIEVPKFMQDELDDLIKPDVEKVETPDERAFP
jgi:hypothetical protein